MPTKLLDRYAQRLLALEVPRLFYLSIPKCGCTYVKNVLWRLRCGEFHPNPVRVHDNESCFPRAIDLLSDPECLSREPLAFTVLRNPVDRFLSLYLDKIVGVGRRKFLPLADLLSGSRGLMIDPSSLSDHHYNLELLIAWLGDNLSQANGFPRDPHWTPQSDRLGVIRQFDLKILVVDRLSLGLEALLAEYVPDISHILLVAERNRSSRSAAKSELLNKTIRQKVNALYSIDRSLYTKANIAWSQLVPTSSGPIEVPRYSSIVSGRRIKT
jgi:hypothetical protein